MTTPNGSAARLALCDQLARLLEYPGSDYVEKAIDAIDRLGRSHPDLIKTLAPLRQHVSSHTVDELEEHYTRCFDINPDCVLEVGWHLYGENYSRGTFLVEMREHMRALEIEENAELPDHLTHVLAVLGRLEESEARQFAVDYLLPALKKIQTNVSDDRPATCVFPAIELVVRTELSIPIADDDAGADAGKEASPYYHELPVLPSECNSQFRRTP